MVIDKQLESTMILFSKIPDLRGLLGSRGIFRGFSRPCDGFKGKSLVGNNGLNDTHVRSSNGHPKKPSSPLILITGLTLKELGRIMELHESEVIPLLTQHYVMLQRNLIYTAVTRGRKLVVIIGSKRTPAIGVRNDKTEKRYTHLQKRLASPK
jgi:hypothetical protein